METFRARRIDKDSDAALVSATKRGDAHAFEKLVLRHKPRVLAAAQWITKNREDAEDVMQESFHKAYLHLDDFQERSLFSTWLTRIAKNQALMLLRRRRRAFEVSSASPDDGAQSVSEAFVDASPNPEESCARRECIELLADAINRLSPTIRRTILLRDIEENSLEETAQILGASIPAVKARVSRGRRQLMPACLDGNVSIFETESASSHHERAIPWLKRVPGMSRRSRQVARSSRHSDSIQGCAQMVMGRHSRRRDQPC